MDTGYFSDRKRTDTSSIKTTTLLSFVLFAMILVSIIWGLATFFINTYYESMRAKESLSVANSLEVQYREFPDTFEEYAVQSAASNRIYIRLDSAGNTMEFNGTVGLNDIDSFNKDIEIINKKLKRSPNSNVTYNVRDTTTESNSRLLFATRIERPGEISTLYIIAPLYPDLVTTRIIKNMLFYISVIVLIIALLLSFALSHRLASPIENLTRAATELSQGNYDVKFDGASFTETKELARALNQASYEMERSEFYQREIIANVSHDLKTPLTMIRSYAEKIIDISGDNPEKRNADLAVIISETERLNTLVTDMMSVSNLQSNNVELHNETFDLVEAAKVVYESVLVLSSSQGYEINFHPSRPAYVVGDRNKIMQVMSNFVANAIKYSGDNKFIDLRLQKSAKKVAFHCIDHGVGIPSEDQRHVWDRYYRTSANHERYIEGTGLGLSIVKGILNLHGASYGVNSEEGKGSDFWFEMETVRKPSARNMAVSKTETIGEDDGEEG
ncbi:MAG TPA: HAMP domain-containing protein [Mogibacterium sp.]|nr:HAMP domain-containing protein [Mogibacterium sp.]